MKKIITAIICFLTPFSSFADEGMWLLPYLNKLNIKQMRGLGLKLEAEDIYSVNKSSLKDAIVIFGGGCTGEVVSPEGLLFTNHHCGYGNIQSLSSLDNNILKNGFWATSHAEEIPAPGLSVTFIRRMEEVTDKVTAGQNVDRIEADYRALYPDLSVEVRDFLGGNQFFAIISERFSDIRLVGTPPDAMGKFGGETDNWMWPRHTADFSVFRIYADKNNKPAAYSPDNQPYKVPVHLKISLKGVKENDFAMIIGFPGSTDRYMTSSRLEHLMNVENANRIAIRGERLAIMMEDMKADESVRLRYASKYAGVSNYWKNSIGKNKALIDNNIPQKRAALEARFQQWATGDYALALPKIRESVEATSHIEGVVQTFSEALSNGIEIVRLAATVDRMIKAENIDNQQITDIAARFFKDYNEPTDRRVAKRMVALVKQRLAPEELPSFYAEIGDDIDAWVDDLYDRTAFSSEEKLVAALEKGGLEEDPAIRLSTSIREAMMPMVNKIREQIDERERWEGLYIKGLTLMDPAAKIYPDANFSQRLTYGTVLPYDPRDGVTYHYYTTLRGVMEKEDPANPMEFSVPGRLKELYAAGDYGRYGEAGELRVNFLTNNDITGGNSGSPVLNARGELIGLAFDGNWEAMSGDILFEPKLQRCINVDIRYVLWTIEKFAGNTNIINELTIVK